MILSETILKFCDFQELKDIYEFSNKLKQQTQNSKFSKMRLLK